MEQRLEKQEPSVPGAKPENHRGKKGPSVSENTQGTCGHTRTQTGALGTPRQGTNQAKDGKNHSDYTLLTG